MLKLGGDTVETLKRIEEEVLRGACIDVYIRDVTGRALSSVFHLFEGP